VTIATTPLGQIRRRASLSESSGLRWLALVMLPVFGLCVIGGPAWRRKGNALLCLAIIGVFLSVTSCSSSGGGSGGSNNPVPSITSLSPTQQAAGSQSQTLSINGSGFIAGSTVTYNGSSHAATLMNTSQLQITLTGSDMATTGSFPVVVSNPSPGGGNSSPVDFNVVSGTPTGNFTVTVNASSGSLAHTTSFNLTVQ